MSLSSKSLLQSFNLAQEIQQYLFYLSVEVEEVDKSWVDSALKHFQDAQNKWLFDLNLMIKGKHKSRFYNEIIANIDKTKELIQNIVDDYQELSPFFQEMFKGLDVIKNSVNLSLDCEDRVIYDQDCIIHLEFLTSQIIS